MSSAPERGIIIGVGHAERQDDGVGPYVAWGLRRRGLAAVVHEGDGIGLLDLWEARRACTVIDAISDPLSPGRVRVFTDLDDPGFSRAAFVHSTHRLGVPEAVALARTLDRLPGRLVVIGVTGSAFGFGRQMSPPVMSASEHLIGRLAGAKDAFGDDVLTSLESA